MSYASIQIDYRLRWMLSRMRKRRSSRIVTKFEAAVSAQSAVVWNHGAEQRRKTAYAMVATTSRRATIVRGLPLARGRDPRTSARAAQQSAEQPRT